jgi:vacuolar protein sorting-associated protein 13A/C
MLVIQLKNAYISQVKKRIFKIVGSLDILGNPTGYASSIGQGFLEIFEAPRRGLIHGPLGFGGGVAKGFGTFITTIISSSFDIVGKISGTLLASCEELQGLKFTEHLSEREPSNIFSGLYYGVKNGVIDIGKGVAGIFIKPYQEAKKSGFGGFIQGVGTGLIGAAVSPVTAGLRIANNLIVGLKNTALIFNPKLKNERFRYPRTIQKPITINSYNEDDALISAILDYLRGYDEHEII